MDTVRAAEANGYPVPKEFDPKTRVILENAICYEWFGAYCESYITELQRGREKKGRRGGKGREEKGGGREEPRRVVELLSLNIVSSFGFLFSQSPPTNSEPWPWGLCSRGSLGT